MPSRFSDHTFQLMRAVTRDNDKVSAMQAVHIMRNCLMAAKLEAWGAGSMPAMTFKRGKDLQELDQHVHVYPDASWLLLELHTTPNMAQMLDAFTQLSVNMQSASQHSEAQSQTYPHAGSPKNRSCIVKLELASAGYHYPT